MSSISENILSAMEIVAQKVISNTNFDQTVLAQIISKEANKNYKIKYQESIFTVSTIDTDNHEYENGDQVYVLLSKTKNLILGLVPQEAEEDVKVQNSQEYIQIGSNCCGFLTSDNDYEPFQLCSYDADVNEIILYNINDGTDLLGLDQELARESITNSTSLLIGAKFSTQLDEIQQGSCNYGVLVTVKHTSGAQVIYTLDVNHMDGNPFAPMAKNEYVDQFFIFNNPDGADFEQIEQISFFCVTPHKDENKIDYDLSMKELRICGMISAAQLGTYSLNIKMPRGNVFTSIDAGENTLEFIAEYRESGKKIEKDTFEYYWFKENRTVVVDSEKYHIYGGKGWELLDVEGNTLALNGSQVFAENTLYKCVVYAAGIKVEKEFEVKSTAAELPKIEILLQEEQTLKVEISNPPSNKGSRLEWYYIFNGINVDITTDSTKNSIAYLGADGYIHYMPQTSPIIFKCAYFYTPNEEGAIEQYLMTASYEVSAEFTLEEYSIVVNGGPQLFQYNEAGLAPQLYQTNFAIEPLSIEFYYKGELQQLTDKEVIWSYPNTKTLINFNGTGAPEKDSMRDGWNNVTVPQFSFELEKAYDITKAANSLIQVTIASREGANGWPQITKDIPITLLKQGDPGTNGSGYYCNITAEGHGHWIIGTTQSLPLKLEVLKDGVNLEEEYSVVWSMLTGSSLTISQTGMVEGIFNNSNPWNVAQVKVTIGDYVLYDTYPIIATVSEDYLLAPNSGFRYVVYDADGTNPSYSRVSFALQNNKVVTWDIPSIPSTYDGDLTVDKRLVVKDRENKIYIPIHMSLNRYEHAWLNDWDGNTLKINEQGNYILAPQIGAGIKNENAFTGITMGTYKQGENSEVGLFGFANGERSIFLDAKTGNAVFGTTKTGQIIIDSEKSIIKSGNFSQNVVTSGMQIDLSEGTILTKNFNIDNSGNATFRGAVTGSTITGGTITGAAISGGSLNIGNGALVASSTGVTLGKGTKIDWNEVSAPEGDGTGVTEDQVGPLAKTYIDAGNVISPNIEGGYLKIYNEKAGVTIDPKNNTIFSVKNSNGDEVIGLDIDGDATFKGVITAKEGGTIGGFTINANSLTTQYNNNNTNYYNMTLSSTGLRFKDETHAESQFFPVITIESTGGSNLFNLDTSGSVQIGSSSYEHVNIYDEGIYLRSDNETDQIVLNGKSGQITASNLYLDGETPIKIADTTKTNTYMEIKATKIYMQSVNSLDTVTLSPDELSFSGYINATGSGKYHLGYTYTGNNTYYTPAIEFDSVVDGTGLLRGRWEIQELREGSSSAITSDLTKKHTINRLSQVYSLLFDQLQPVSYKYNDSRSDRTHTGFIAQHVEQAVIDCGLTTQNFAAVCYDLDEEGNKVDYRIRYEELIALCVDQIQKLKARVSELENQIQN